MYFSMYVGGINSLPFNANKSQSVVVSFVPKTVKLPPVVSLTYNVTILDSTGKPLYSHTYDDSHGVLDLELVPIHKNMQSTSNAVASQKQFTTWGPDFIGQEAAIENFHIQYQRRLHYPLTIGCKYNCSNENRKKKLLIYFPIF